MRYGSALPLIPLFNKWADGTALSLWESRSSPLFFRESFQEKTETFFFVCVYFYAVRDPSAVNPPLQQVGRWYCIKPLVE
ncbi:MAG: hypothetical protein IJN24_09010 [Bacteroidaceae bacterium]|nr:hypothetical protein [Bacteroidaceae bacterium]